MDSFALESDFEKSKVLDLVERARAFLVKTGNVQTALWSIEPWSFTLHIQLPQNTDLSVLMKTLYEWEEVFRVTLGVEQTTKWILLNVALNERWFCEDRKKKNEKPARRRHPEDQDFVA